MAHQPTARCPPPESARPPAQSAGVRMTDRAVAILGARLAEVSPRMRWDATSASGLLIEVLIREGRLDAAWDAARRHGCHDGIWRRLAEASEEDRPAGAIAVYERLAE